MSFSAYEIRKVANGYLVHPAAPAMSAGYTASSEIHVFETFENLVDFLEREFDPNPLIIKKE
jgi:hypothetical protein